MDRILFVDEDLAFMETTQRRLNSIFDIDVAQGGRDGLNAVAGRGPFAVIVTDLHMTGMNGFEFVAKAKEIDPDSVVVMLTGEDKLDVSLKAMDGGKVFRFLIKTCNPQVLETTLRESVKYYHSNRHWDKKPEADASHRHKILIVDDDPEILSVCAVAANTTGQYDVLTAENGKIALELIKFIKMDLILADLNLPDMDGIRLLTAVHRREPEMGLFLMTWQPPSEFQGREQEIKLGGVFEKPLDVPAVLAAIQTSQRSDLKGGIEGFRTASFLQMIEMEEKTCTIQVRWADRLGLLFFRKGQLIAAETGDMKNEDAAYEIINWEDSAIEIAPADLDKQTEINRPLMYILVEAARRHDEAKEMK